MNKLTLNSLAERVAALEKAIAVKGQIQPPKDWRKTIGMFRDSDFMREVDEECLRSRDAEREAARLEKPAE